MLLCIRGALQQCHSWIFVCCLKIIYKFLPPSPQRTNRALEVFVILNSCQSVSNNKHVLCVAIMEPCICSSRILIGEKATQLHAQASTSHFPLLQTLPCLDVGSVQLQISLFSQILCIISFWALHSAPIFSWSNILGPAVIEEGLHAVVHLRLLTLQWQPTLITSFIPVLPTNLLEREPAKHPPNSKPGPSSST